MTGVQTCALPISRELTNDGIMVFLNKVVKLRLRLLLAEAFREVKYLISPEGDETGCPHSDPDGEDEQEGIISKFKRRASTASLSARFGCTGHRTNECIHRKFSTCRLIQWLQAIFSRSCRTGFRAMLGGLVNRAYYVGE